jgi:hypothetical protein
MCIDVRAVDKIAQEIEMVKELAVFKAAGLGTSRASDRGLEILHIFVADLLGRDTQVAKIFENKANTE